MITLCRRTFVSIAAITTTLALGACASAASHSRPDRTISTEERLLSIRFENVSTEAADVYLLGSKREWMLGRVAPGAIASLRLPDEAFGQGSMMVRLAVIAGETRTFTAARDPRAVFTIATPASKLLSQRWTFSPGNLTSLPY